MTGIVIAAAVALPATAQAADFHVTSTADTAPGNPCATPLSCSLRGAIEASNAGSGPNRILITPGTYVLGFGQLNVGDGAGVETTLEREGTSGTVTIDGSNASRVLDIVAPGATTTLRDLTITGGRANFGAGINADTDLVLDDITSSGNTALASLSLAGGGGLRVGAAVSTSGTLTVENNTAAGLGIANAQGGGIFLDAGASGTLSDVVLRGNTATAVDGAATGGGLSSGAVGTVGLTRALVDGNTATSTGTGSAGAAGLATIPAGGFDLTDSRVTGNVASAANSVFGGGAALGATTTIANSTFDANIASSSTPGSGFGALGGGALLSGATTIVNSTFTANVAATATTTGASTFGGGLVIMATPTTITATTITDNVATSAARSGLGAGLYVVSPTTLTGSILAGNISDLGSDCIGSFLTSAGGNVLPTALPCGVTPTGTDAVSDTPGLAALGDNGGFAPTMLPLAGSPALDRYTTGCPATDERGVSRPQGPACDSGAVELAVTPPPPPPPPPPPVAGTATIPACRDLDLDTTAGTPAALTLRCSPGVWNWAVTVAPEHGTLSAINATGSLTYTPDPGFHGDDRFRYVAHSSGGQSNTALAVVHVTGSEPTPAPTANPTPHACTLTVRLNPGGTLFVRARVSGAPAHITHNGTAWNATVTVTGHTTIHISGRRPNGKLTRRTLTLSC